MPTNDSAISTSETMLRVGTYNTWERGMYPERSGERERYNLQTQVLAQDLPSDIWMVQELGSEKAFMELADDLGMACTASSAVDGPLQAVFDPGRIGFGVGVMWNENAGITAVPGTARIFTDDMFFHGAASVILDIRGTLMLFASSHATPWGAPQSTTEAKRWLSILTRSNRGMPGDLANQVLPGALGTDSNGISADIVTDSNGTARRYAPDPFRDQPWRNDMIYQCTVTHDENTGIRTHQVDRAAADILWAGGLHDTCALLNKPLTPTVGYHWTDPLAPIERDADHIRVNDALVSAVRAVDVADNERVVTVSDHRPKRVTLQLPATN